MRILICGGEGQLAQGLISYGKTHPEGVDIIAPPERELDVTDEGSVIKAFHDHQPDAVINTAAFHRVDACEKEVAKTFHVNAFGAYLVAKQSALAGARSVFISTGYVFDGNKASPYTEDDETSPINIYGHSKALGERLVLSSDPRSLVVRTNALFGSYGKNVKGGQGNFIDMVAQSAKEGKALQIVNDQRIAPTAVDDVVATVMALLAGPQAKGIFHVTNSGEATWFGIAQFVCRELKKQSFAEPVSSETRNASACRPRNALLVDTRLASFGVCALPSWENAVREHLKAQHTQGSDYVSERVSL